MVKAQVKHAAMVVTCMVVLTPVVLMCAVAIASMGAVSDLARRAK